MKRLIRSLPLFCLAASLCPADILPEGGGIIFGEDHVFSLKAPKGWVLDNQSAVKSGIHAVFYPKGSTWADSEAVAYARSRPIDDKVKTVQDTVDSVLAEFHKNGSPDYKGKKDQELKTEGEQVGIVYKFSGDKWGNFEAVCYFKEEKTINFVVLSSRDEKAFKVSLPSFLELCKSYTYISDHVQTKADPKKKEEGEAAEEPDEP